MIEIKSNNEDNILMAFAHGTVTGADYNKTFIPAVEEKLRHSPRIRLLYQLGNDFSGYTLAAIWDDAKLALEHLTGFEKIAIITDVHWVSDASKAFGVFIPCPVRVFANDKILEATTWLNSGN